MAATAQISECSIMVCMKGRQESGRKSFSTGFFKSPSQTKTSFTPWPDQQEQRQKGLLKFKTELVDQFIELSASLNTLPRTIQPTFHGDAVNRIAITNDKQHLVMWIPGDREDVLIAQSLQFINGLYLFALDVQICPTSTLKIDS